MDRGTALMRLFPSGVTVRTGDRAIGDLPLTELGELVVRRCGTPVENGRREALLTALGAGAGGAATSATAAIMMVTPPAALATKFGHLLGRRPPCRHPDYLRRRMAWAVQAEKLGGR
jgi:hypothetical protein